MDHNFGDIERGFVQAEVSWVLGVGDLAGWNVGGRIVSSLAPGQEESLVGFGTPAR